MTALLNSTTPLRNVFFFPATFSSMALIAPALSDTSHCTTPIEAPVETLSSPLRTSPG